MNRVTSPNMLSVAAALAAGMVLAACQTSGKLPDAKPAKHAQTTVVAGSSPTDVYAKLAGRVKNCWLNPADPVLTKHIFHAEASPDGSATNIVIHERAPDGRRGLKAYTINFESRGRDTKVVTANQRLPYALSQKLSADVGRWVQGSTLCEIKETRGSAPIPSSRPRN